MKAMFEYLAIWRMPIGWAFYAKLTDAKQDIEKYGKGYVCVGKKYHVYNNGAWAIQSKRPVGLIDVSEWAQ